MKVRLALSKSTISFGPSEPDITREVELPGIPRLGETIENAGEYYRVTHIVYSEGQPPTVVGIPTDNPF